MSQESTRLTKSYDPSDPGTTDEYLDRSMQSSRAPVPKYRPDLKGETPKEPEKNP